MATSFLSEHSVEFILVPRIVSCLQSHFSKVIPIYFWSSREGSLISRECNTSQPVKVVNLFARRPKISAPNQRFIEVKFNYLLFETAQLAATFGIPTFAGVPVASSIFDISLDTKCAFFELFDSKVEIIVNLSLSGDILDRPAHSKELDLIGPQELMERVVSKCHPSCWENVTENLRTIRRGRFDTFYGHPIFGPTYHPLHLILVD